MTGRRKERIASTQAGLLCYNMHMTVAVDALILLDAMPDAVLICDATTGRVVAANEAAERLLGMTRDTLIQTGLPPVCTPVGTPDAWLQADMPLCWQLRACGQRCQAVDVQVRHLPASDVVLVQLRPLAPAPAIETALQESEAHLRSLFANMNEGVALHELVMDEAGQAVNYRVIDVNPQYEEIVGVSRDEVVGKLATEIYGTVTPPYLDFYAPVALTGESSYLETYFAPLDKHFFISIAPWGRCGFATLFLDVTDRKRSEEAQKQFDERMQHAQKLESLGVLAGGIAHDFNNLLVAVLGYADLALRQMQPMAPGRDCLREIVKAAERAADLCRQMLAYSGKGQFIIEDIDLRTLLDEMVHLLKTTISKKVLLNLKLERHLPPLRGDATQLRQVVMNLVMNASEAIDDQSGVISIATGALHCTKSYLRDTFLDENLPEGLYVWLEVSDTGSGMDEAMRLRIFDPFFTTKFTGRGLGLAAVMGIIRGHRGAINVYSEPGKGTTFKVLFPAVPSGEFHALAPSSSADPYRGTGTVLLVDDEETVRALGAVMLEKLGFTPLVAADGLEALDLYQAHREEITLVILDLTMPRLNGEETYRELRQRDPDVRVILTSGYSEYEFSARFAGKGIAGFLQKPFTFATLQTRIEHALRSDA